MSDSVSSSAYFAASVFHPTDFSEESKIAFAHALALSLVNQSKLTIMDVSVGVNQRGNGCLSCSPVGDILERWGLNDERKPTSEALANLRLEVQRLHMQSRWPLVAVLDYLSTHAIDLMVLATHSRGSLFRWIHNSVAEPLARRAKKMTLFVPTEAAGFVSPVDGELSLKRILVPLGQDPRQVSAIRAAAAIAQQMGNYPVEIALSCVSESTSLPEVPVPSDQEMTWRRIHLEGYTAVEIVGKAKEISADLLVMENQIQRGLLGTIHGNATAEVLRHTPCPVLVVPRT